MVRETTKVEVFTRKLKFRTLMRRGPLVAGAKAQVIAFPTEIVTAEQLEKFATMEAVAADVAANPPAWAQAFIMLARHVGLLVPKKKGKPMAEIEEEIGKDPLEGAGGGE